MITLQDAVDDLYRIAVVEGKTTSTSRLRVLANYCVQELGSRGLVGVETEAAIPGAGRDKQWDVAWRHGGKYRLGVSLKSILRNLAGTVPNRIDDLIGETANVQLYSPEIVVAYIMVFDIEQDAVSATHGVPWAEVVNRRLTALSGRRRPAWTTGVVEDYVLVKVRFRSQSHVVSTSQSMDGFFDGIVEQVVQRNPGALGNT